MLEMLKPYIAPFAFRRKCKGQTARQGGQRSRAEACDKLFLAMVPKKTRKRRKILTSSRSYIWSAAAANNAREGHSGHPSWCAVHLFLAAKPLLFRFVTHGKHGTTGETGSRFKSLISFRKPSAANWQVQAPAWLISHLEALGCWIHFQSVQTKGTPK